MKTAIVDLESVSAYGQSKHYTVDPLNKEGKADYEKRTWRERMHYNEEGFMFIPPMAFKNCLAGAAKYLSIQIPGKGKSTYTKHFGSGILVTEPLVLSVKKDDVPGVWLFVPSDGRTGGGSRVEKCFPVIQKWAGRVTFYILDDIITQDVFSEVLSEAGKFIGIGFFRPERNGFYGRFKINKVEWKE